MSAQQPAPSQLAALLSQMQQQGNGQPQEPPPNPLSGELPGAGYLYADSPEKRLQAMIKTDPETVRQVLLRTIEVLAFNAQLPFGEKEPDKLMHGVLMGAQAFLLLDPSVDEAGIPLTHHIELNEAAQEIQKENEPKEKALQNARGQNPRPRPRIGS